MTMFFAVKGGYYNIQFCFWILCVNTSCFEKLKDSLTKIDSNPILRLISTYYY